MFLFGTSCKSRCIFNCFAQSAPPVSLAIGAFGDCLNISLIQMGGGGGGSGAPWLQPIGGGVRVLATPATTHQRHLANTRAAPTKTQSTEWNHLNGRPLYDRAAVRSIIQ